MVKCCPYMTYGQSNASSMCLKESHPWQQSPAPCRDPKAFAYAIKRSCENKAEVVALDEKESGVRATLNLGHTFGHVSLGFSSSFVFLLKFA